MIKSIQQFQTEGIKRLEKVFVDFSGDMTKFAEMVYGVKENVLLLGRSMIEEELEYYDDWLRKSSKRKEGWQIVRTDETTLTTSIGSITYHKTLFRNKQSGEREYLLDRCMGLKKHTRLMEDAIAATLEEAAESNYRKGGEHASIGMENISKTAVMDKIHALKFPAVERPGEKKAVSCLYIDADEDHVALQHLELVRYQKIEKAAGAEEDIYTCADMIRMENRNRERLGALADLPIYDIPYPQIKKIANFKNHIWGL